MSDPYTPADPYVRSLLPGASLTTILRRCFYGGRKGRAARRRLFAGIPCEFSYDDGSSFEGMLRAKPRTQGGFLGVQNMKASP